MVQKIQEHASGNFCIQIDFAKNTPYPSRVFQGMSNLIDAFQNIDRTLVKSIDIQIEPALILEDIETGSLKTWLITMLDAAHDDALKNISWKPLVGQYLVKAKYIIINKLKGKTSITNRADIADIQEQLLQSAEATDVRRIPAYNPISQKEIVGCIERITSSLESLSKEDKAKYILPDEEVPFNLDFQISPEQIEDLITREEIQSKTTMIMKVKKPDYLGESKWEFIFDNHIIQVKILDDSWLSDFQERKLDVRPGDSIKADVLVRVKYDYDFNVINTYYEAEKITQILRPLVPNQLKF